MAKEIPLRSQVAESDKWDLSSLYPCDEAWENDLKRLQKKIEEAGKFKGNLGKSPENLVAAMKWLTDAFMLGEQVYVYASLKSSAEADDPENQRKIGLISQVYGLIKCRDQAHWAKTEHKFDTVESAQGRNAVPAPEKA